MSLRGRPIHRTATLPDGRELQVRVGVPEDSYIPRRELDTVDVELFADGRAVAAVNTVLSADQESEAGLLALAGAVRSTPSATLSCPHVGPHQGGTSGDLEVVFGLRRDMTSASAL